MLVTRKSEEDKGNEEEDDAFIFVDSSDEVEDDDGFVLTASTRIDSKTVDPTNFQEGQCSKVFETSTVETEDPGALFVDNKSVDNFVGNHPKIKQPVLGRSILVCLIFGNILTGVIVIRGRRVLGVENTFSKNNDFSVRSLERNMEPQVK
jgi:hypothetical protein